MLAIRRRNKIRDEIIRRRVGAQGLHEIVDKARLRCNAHVMRIEKERIPMKMMDCKGEPRKRWEKQTTESVQSEVLDVKLSSLSVDGVCDLFTKVEDLNSPSTPQYVSVMRENNISGRVLLHCDLEELKKVLQMNFGDWELFRMIVVSLREQELTCFSHQEELNYKNVRFAVPSPHATPQLPERKGLAPMFLLKNTRIC
uniref:Kinase D-interacting substrate of 220 kDa-like SAM domain-containing protein n=1 Tax=Timema shepardi TaxID=629360 RepID=A0A7R9G211_TIMSH|nr:unnamed protein product [Timema shepardi]